MKTVNEIPLFKDLTQFDFNDEFYDLHNDFLCTRIRHITDTIEIEFINKSNLTLLLKFKNVIISKFEMQPTKTANLFIIDSLYRGRFESEKGLLEYTSSERGYFYLEFYEGFKLEFLAKSLDIVSSS